jgi:hypothetical protein
MVLRLKFTDLMLDENISNQLIAYCEKSGVKLTTVLLFRSV